MTQFWIISGYLGLLLLLGLLASRCFSGTKVDYQLASHSIGPFLLLMSLFGTTMTAFALVGSSGEAFKEGIGVYGNDGEVGGAKRRISSEAILHRAGDLAQLRFIVRCGEGFDIRRGSCP